MTAAQQPEEILQAEFEHSKPTHSLKMGNIMFWFHVAEIVRIVVFYIRAYFIFITE